MIKNHRSDSRKRARSERLEETVLLNTSGWGLTSGGKCSTCRGDRIGGLDNGLMSDLGLCCTEIRIGSDLGLLFRSFGGNLSFFDEQEKRDIRRETRFCGLVINNGDVSRITVGVDVGGAFRVGGGAALTLRFTKRSFGFGCCCC